MPAIYFSPRLVLSIQLHYHGVVGKNYTGGFSYFSLSVGVPTHRFFCRCCCFAPAGSSVSETPRKAQLNSSYISKVFLAVLAFPPTTLTSQTYHKFLISQPSPPFIFGHAWAFYPCGAFMPQTSGLGWGRGRIHWRLRWPVGGAAGIVGCR